MLLNEPAVSQYGPEKCPMGPHLIQPSMCQDLDLDWQVVVYTGLVVVFSNTVLFLYIFSCVCLSLSICAILLTVFDFSTYMVNKHLIIDGSLGTRNPPSKWYLDRFGHFSRAYGHYQQTDHTTPVTTDCILQCCPCNVAQLPSVLWCCWLGGSKSIWPVKNLSGGVLAWLSVWS